MDLLLLYPEIFFPQENKFLLPKICFCVDYLKCYSSEADSFTDYISMISYMIEISSDFGVSAGNQQPLKHCPT